MEKPIYVNSTVFKVSPSSNIAKSIFSNYTSWARSPKTANGFVVVCSPLVAKSGPTGAEHVARSQLDRYVLFLIQSVIINCEIQCSYKRVITLLNVYFNS